MYNPGLKELLREFIFNPEDPDINFRLGIYYDDIDQTASAVSYFLRCSERTEDKVIQYKCMLKAAFCFEKQGCRNFTVRGLYQHAVALLPKRPEAYFFLSRFLEREENYHDAYLIASVGNDVAEDLPPLDIDIDYPGFWGLIYEKAVSSWWTGLCDESRSMFEYLYENCSLDETHLESVKNNLKNLNSTKLDLHEVYDEIIVRKDIIGSTSDSSIISKNLNRSVWIVDNFYDDPDSIREFGLKQDYHIGGIGRGYIGNRTHEQFLFPGLKEKFESIMGRKITKWKEYGMNGRFQYCWAGQPQVWHCDSQQWGGMIYLTPDAPYECGTSLYAHKKNRARTYNDEGFDAAWVNIEGDPHLDGSSFEPVDVMGNVYNRLVIFDASCIHSSSGYFGTVKENCRFWQMFFFDT